MINKENKLYNKDNLSEDKIQKIKDYIDKLFDEALNELEVLAEE